MLHNVQRWVVWAVDLERGWREAFWGGECCVGFSWQQTRRGVQCAVCLFGSPFKIDTHGREGWKWDGQRAKSGCQCRPRRGVSPPCKALTSSRAFRRARVGQGGPGLYTHLWIIRPWMRAAPYMANGCSRTRPCSRGHQSFTDGYPG